MIARGLEDSYRRFRAALDAVYLPVAAPSLTIKINTNVTARKRNGDYIKDIPTGSTITIYRGQGSHGSNEIIIPSFKTRGGVIYENKKFYKVNYGTDYYWVSHHDLEPHCLRYGYNL